ncbi:hypothetical protein J6590_071955 [Homalodisca vitripennis]|nr:hypothetical protein J6590_071955 [Homalodisca vitripennis]
MSESSEPVRSRGLERRTLGDDDVAAPEAVSESSERSKSSEPVRSRGLERCTMSTLL